MSTRLAVTAQIGSSHSPRQSRRRPTFGRSGRRGGGQGVYPRLALVSPSGDARDRSIESLRALGASCLYPRSLDAEPSIRGILQPGPPCTGAAELAERLFTLPVTAANDIAVVVRTLASLSGSRS